MKRNIFKILMVGGVSLLAMTSCEKKLDLYPYDSIELSQSFKTIQDARAWNNSIFQHLRGRVYGLYMYSQDVQGDQLNATLDYGNRNGNPHRWDDSFRADDYTIRDVWQGYYSTMKNVNAIIQNMPNVETANANEAAEINQFIGNAHLMRAYLYHELALRYAKPYDPATADNTLGLPLVLEYDPNLKPARSSLKATYDQIISDINEAKTRLANVAGEQGATRFTIDAAKALEARVKLYIQDWPGAKTAADEVINTGKYPLITDAADFQDYWHVDGYQESIMQMFISQPTETANTNTIYLGWNNSLQKFVPDFVPSQWVVDAYENNDIRKAAYFKQVDIQISGTVYPNSWVVNKYPGNPAYFTGATTNYMHEPKVFRIAEMYLISAEAAYNMGGANEDQAQNRLNELRTARGLDPVASTGAALLQDIKDERFRELAFEGVRLFDLKRWNEPVVRRDPQNEEYINVTPAASFHQLNIPAGHNKFTWGIPTNDITTNPSLQGQQNPGW
jgi:hypothetical protein